MNGQVEIADGERGAGVFPAAWGVPRGAQGSEERAAWIAGHARADHLARLLVPTYRRTERRTP